MTETNEVINAVFWLVVAIVSLVPFSIFLMSYLRVRSKKLLFTTVAFFLFFIKAITLAMKLYIPGADGGMWYLDDEFWWSVAAILDITIIVLIAYSLTRKS